MDAVDSNACLLDGKGGNDFMTGGFGTDTFLHRVGDGNDTINCRVGSGVPDQLILMGSATASLNPSNITFEQDGFDLVIHENVGGVSETITDQLYFQPYFNDAAVGSIKVFANEAAYNGWLADPTDNSANLLQEWTPDGTGEDTANALRNNIIQLSTAQGHETINSFNWDGNTADYMGYYYNYVDGSAGNDYINSGDFDDTLVGGQNDTLVGGTGNDSLVGNGGSNTYIFNRGDGNDTVNAGNGDKAQYATDIGSSQLWFQQSGNDLIVSIIGTSDSEDFSNWYSGSQNHVGQFDAGDGKVLLASQVQNLVSAMASFSPPSMGQTSFTDLPTSEQNTLMPLLAANWG